MGAAEAARVGQLLEIIQRERRWVSGKDATMELSSQILVVRLSNGVVAGTSEIDSSTLDTAGYDGAVIVTAFGAITAGSVVAVKLQDGATTSPTTDVLGSSQAVADTDDNKQVLHDIYRPRNRYLRVVVTRTSQNAVLDGIWAILYRGRKEPIAVDTTSVAATKVLISPAQGTA
jgi:hypothetical protein